jgi:glutamate racemase
MQMMTAEDMPQVCNTRRDAVALAASDGVARRGTSPSHGAARHRARGILAAMSDLPIGIFDSGLGGLTVARAVMEALPDESVVYLGDTARCPYGPRPLDDVRRYVLEIGEWLVERPVKLIVVACNTGTAAGLALAQRTFPLPVIGVVEPGARAAEKATVNRKVGVIGTVGTIESGAYAEAVRALDAGVTVFSVATPKFVDVVEAGLRRGPGPLEDWMSDSADVFVRPTFFKIARDYLDPLKRAGIDTLVLGCTHFPLLSAAIQSVVGSRVRLISSAAETAREVADTLRVRGQSRETRDGAAHAFATTGDPEEFRRLGARVLRREIAMVEAVELDELRALGERAGETPERRARSAG